MSRADVDQGRTRFADDDTLARLRVLEECEKQASLEVIHMRKERDAAIAAHVLADRERQACYDLLRKCYPYLSTDMDACELANLVTLALARHNP